MASKASEACDEIVTTLQMYFVGTVAFSRAYRPRFDEMLLGVVKAYVVPIGMTLTKISRTQARRDYTIGIFVVSRVEDQNSTEIDDLSEITEEIQSHCLGLNLTIGRLKENGVLTTALNDNEALQTENRYTSLTTLEITGEVVEYG